MFDFFFVKMAGFNKNLLEEYLYDNDIEEALIHNQEATSGDEEAQSSGEVQGTRADSPEEVQATQAAEQEGSEEEAEEALVVISSSEGEVIEPQVPQKLPSDSSNSSSAYSRNLDDGLDDLLNRTVDESIREANGADFKADLEELLRVKRAELNFTTRALSKTRADIKHADDCLQFENRALGTIRSTLENLRQLKEALEKDKLGSFVERFRVLDESVVNFRSFVAIKTNDLKLLPACPAGSGNANDRTQFAKNVVGLKDSVCKILGNIDEKKYFD